MNVTFEQMTDWILEHRSGDAFRGYTRDEILMELVASNENGLMFFCADDDRIFGIVTAQDYESNGRPLIHVRNAITTSPEAMPLFLLQYYRTYRDIPLERRCHGSNHQINVTKLLKRAQRKGLVYGR